MFCSSSAVRFCVPLFASAVRSSPLRFADLANLRNRDNMLRQAISRCPLRVGGPGRVPMHATDDSALLDRADFTGLVFGCIETKFCKKIFVGKLSPRSTQCTPLHRSLILKFSSKLHFCEKYVIFFANLLFFEFFSLNR